MFTVSNSREKKHVTCVAAVDRGTGNNNYCYITRRASFRSVFYSAMGTYARCPTHVYTRVSFCTIRWKSVLKYSYNRTRSSAAADTRCCFFSTDLFQTQIDTSVSSSVLNDESHLRGRGGEQCPAKRTDV